PARTGFHRGVSGNRRGLVAVPHVQRLRQVGEPATVGHLQEHQRPRTFRLLGQDRAPRPAEVVAPPESAPVVVVIRHLVVNAMLVPGYAQPTVRAEPRYEEPTHPTLAEGLVVDDERSADGGELDLAMNAIIGNLQRHPVPVGVYHHPVAPYCEGSEVGGDLEV